MEWVSGNIFIRPNAGSHAGSAVAGHGHHFDHTTFFLSGWHLVRGTRPDGSQIVGQFCSPEYRAYRELQMKYEPSKVLRPVRMADTYDESGRAHFALVFIEPGDSVPEGGEEILFTARHYHALIKAEIVHELVSLSDGASFACVYAHREPQGDVVQEVTGWTQAYK